jgi:hypothetical protein
MPEMSMKAKAEIAAMFTVTVITPLQRCLELARPRGVAINAKHTIAIAVKYPIRSAAIVISIPPLGTMLQEQEKSCALRHTRLGKKWNYSRPTRDEAEIEITNSEVSSADDYATTAPKLESIPIAISIR